MGFYATAPKLEILTSEEPTPSKMKREGSNSRYSLGYHVGPGDVPRVPCGEALVPYEAAYFHKGQVDPALWARYIKQIRESDGFDVDCYPRGTCFSRMHPVEGFKESPESFEKIFQLCVMAISEYNSKHEKGYEVVDVERVNEEYRAGIMYYITFQVKDPQAAGDGNGDGPLEIFQARVWVGIRKNPEVELCRPKPNNGKKNTKQHNTYPNRDNPALGYYPNLSYRNTQNVLQPEQNNPPPENKVNLEEVMVQLATSQTQLANSQTQLMNETRIALQNQSTQIRNLEVQISQMATLLSERQQGSLPNTSGVNPRSDGTEYCKYSAV